MSLKKKTFIGIQLQINYLPSDFLRILGKKSKFFVYKLQQSNVVRFK